MDVLFIGGVLYACGIDSHLKEYLRALKTSDNKKAVALSTSWISRCSIDLIKKGLAEAGIPVAGAYFHVKSKSNGEQLKDAEAFARKSLQRKMRGHLYPLRRLREGLSGRQHHGDGQGRVFPPL